MSTKSKKPDSLALVITVFAFVIITSTIVITMVGNSEVFAKGQPHPRQSISQSDHNDQVTPKHHNHVVVHPYNPEDLNTDDNTILTIT